MGESAGGGSIEHHLTALDQRPVFTRAILQSPAFFPQYLPTPHASIFTDLSTRWDDNQLQTQFYNFAAQAGCTANNTVACLRGRPELTLALANNATVGPAPTGQFIYGPAIDNTFVPNMPGVQFMTGRYWGGIRVLVGHTQYTTPFSRLS